MKVHVLGSGAGGGFPQWNCNGVHSSAVRAGTQVEFLHGEAAQRAAEAGGIVAQLYYAIN